MQIYTVTFCTMDQEADSNPFWHTCLLLSRYDASMQKMEVVETWGFGGVPATSSNAFMRKLKRNLDIDTDFYGNHGLLYEEEMRRLDRGYGLHGVTFELTAEKFKQLQQKCRKIIADQSEAISDAVRDLKLTANEAIKFRNYLYEQESYRIFQYELKRAQEENRDSRLQEFAIGIASAHTCKAHVLRILDGIITPAQLERVRGWKPAIPRFSGKLENIYLHSTGPLSQHTKNSGQVVHFRKNSDSKLYWTLPPQEIETLTEISSEFLKISPDYVDCAKQLIRKLQTLEWFFRNVEIGEEHALHRDKLIQRIIIGYEAFAKLTPLVSQSIQNNWLNFSKFLASLPRNNAEEVLLNKIKNAQDFLNNLYMAIVDGWDLSILNSEFEKDEDLEGLAAYLLPHQQRELCRIIGRRYIAPDEEASIDSLSCIEAQLTSTDAENYIPRLG